jgi:hypothetical protein
MRIIEKTYSLGEAAEFLKTTEESIFMRINGQMGTPLNPSIYVGVPTLMQRIEVRGKDGYCVVTEGKKTGLFGLTGSCLKWNKIGLAQITFGAWPLDRVSGGSSRVFLYQNDYTYMVVDALKISRDELIITLPDMLQYIRETKDGRLSTCSTPL